MSVASAGEMYDAELYQQAGLALRRAVDAFAEPEIAKGIVDIDKMVAANVNYETGRPPTYARIFQRAYDATGSGKYLGHFCSVADLLVAVKQPAGGYAHTAYVKRVGAEEKRERNITFRDGRDLSAVRVILEAYRYTSDEKYLRSATQTAHFLLEAQYDCGAWPSVYPPPKSGWLAAPMFNDLVTISQVGLLMAVYEVTKDARHLEGIKKAGQFLIDWQLPQPTPGWAQQYNWDKTPAWGRAFEPPSACGLPSTRVIGLLLDIYLLTGEEKFLGPIPAAASWLDEARLGPNEWARFYEPSTGKAIYAASHDERDIRYDREVLYEGYAQWGDWGFNRINARCKRLGEVGRENLMAEEGAAPSVEELRERVVAAEPGIRELIGPEGFIGKYPTEGGDVRALADPISTLAGYLITVRTLRARG